MREFSVAVFTRDDRYHYLKRFVSAREAIEAFKRATEANAAQGGLWRRIIVTDGGDYTNMEWKYGMGITYPSALS